jgi:pimeloyl-ACP methyl ester carboxylesterase
MASFVLVHGSAHSFSAWDLVKAELEAKGHTVITPELPDNEPDASATRYADIIAASIPDQEEPIVVAHSASGLYLPLVPALHRVKRIVFLAAAVPRIGMSFIELYKAEPEMINPAWVGKDPRVAGVSEEFLLHDCPQERLRSALSTIRVMVAQRAYVETCPLGRWPDVAASYIVCADDRTIQPAWQRNVARTQLGIEPIELPGGHCPYISRPKELAEALLQHAT